MSPSEFLQKKALLEAFEAIRRNRAYIVELLPLFRRNFDQAIAGLRNRKRTREERDEHLQAADDAEKLVKFVNSRIESLTAELRVPPSEMDESDGDRDYP